MEQLWELVWFTSLNKHKGQILQAPFGLECTAVEKRYGRKCAGVHLLCWIHPHKYCLQFIFILYLYSLERCSTLYYLKICHRPPLLKPWSPPLSLTQERRCDHLFPARHLQCFLHICVNTSSSYKCILCCCHQVFLDFPSWWPFWRAQRLQTPFQERCVSHPHSRN